MAENTSQTKLTPFQKLKRVVSRRSVKNLGSKLSLDKYIQPDDTDNEILFNSNNYKPDYWNISTESPPAWFDPKVTPRQLSETGGAKFKSAGKVVDENPPSAPPPPVTKLQIFLLFILGNQMFFSMKLQRKIVSKFSC